jgi:hypothetical protein
MSTDKEQTSIRLEQESMAVLRGLCDCHAWTTGQAVSELCLFYKRIQEKTECFHVCKDKDGGEYIMIALDDKDWRDLSSYPEQSTDILLDLLGELKKDVRNAFRKSEKQGE